MSVPPAQAGKLAKEWHGCTTAQLSVCIYVCAREKKQMYIQDQQAKPNWPQSYWVGMQLGNAKFKK